MNASAGFSKSPRPLIFLDFDDVIVLNRPGDFGGYAVSAPDAPPEFWPRVLHVPATQTLVEAVVEHGALVVITTSWLKFMMLNAFERLFAKAGLAVLNESMHDAWDAPQNRGETRVQAIDRWLAAHHRGEPYVILDDELSGTGLRNSVHERRGRLVLCQENVGLHRGHLAQIRAALSKPTK